MPARSARRPARLLAAAALLALATAALAPAAAGAQSLRGSKASIERMYRQARAEKLHFYQTSSGVQKAGRAGRLATLRPNAHLGLHRVRYPWVQPATKMFVERLAEQYHIACGEMLIVTSAIRPSSRQPWNASDRSVHPTGMAVDLRKSNDPQCRRWLRDALVGLERAGVIEATEEFGPPHFHVAVFGGPYTRYVENRNSGAEVAIAAAEAASADEGDAPAPSAPAAAPAPRRAGAPVTRYRVRAGDTLWDIAREHDTTVAALRRANNIRGADIRPGMRLVIPAGR